MGATVSKLEWQEKSSRNSVEESVEYKRSYALISALVTESMSPEFKSSITTLRGTDAQSMIDFLNKVLNDDNGLQPDQRRRLFYLFMKLVKSAQVYPKSFELTGVNCKLAQPVNEGGYGSIYKGELQGHEVCVKAVRMYQVGIAKQKLRAHAGEFALWAHISHPNVLPFYGVYASDEKQVSRICIVSPWMDAGNLTNYLNNHPGSPRIPLLIDILSGLEHLHQLDVIHSDIKAGNVLVAETGRAVVADFGVSFIGMTNVGTTTSADFAGSVNWMAPELLTVDRPEPTKESDMWSFGCTCYEVITGKVPFEQYKVAPQLIRAFMTGDVDPLRTGSGDYQLNNSRVKPLMRRCFDYDSMKRPSSAEAKSFLIGLGVNDSRPPAEIDRGVFRPGKAHHNPPTIDYNCVYSVLQKENERQIYAHAELAWVVYDYAANPHDPNEISLREGDSLQVLDMGGRWWKVRKGDGTIGIVPSTCVELASSPFLNDAFSKGTRNRHLSSLSGFYTDGPLSSSSDASATCPSADTLYKYKALARYNYSASPGDETEFSFLRGETFELIKSLRSGRWWRVRRSNGRVGIVPSTFVSLTSDLDIPRGESIDDIGVTFSDPGSPLRENQLLRASLHDRALYHSY